MTLQLDDLDTRRSVPALQLGEPAPDAATLLRALQTAVRVPDHGRLVPFRFVELRGDDRIRLGEAMAMRHQAIDADVPAAALEKDRARFTHAPLIITVIADQGPHHKIPEVERLLTAGSAAFLLLQAIHAQGYGGVWLTGWASYDEAVRRWFGVADHEVIVGFIHIGTPKIEVPERDRPDPVTLLSKFDGSLIDAGGAE